MTQVQNSSPLLDLEQPSVPMGIQRPLEVMPRETRVSPNELIQEEDQMSLLAISEAMTRDYFTIGDMAGKYIAMAEEKGYRFRRTLYEGDIYVTEQDIFNAIGFFVHRKGRTVRYYHETARFYPQEVREEFKLDFAYFVMARSFKERWREVLEFSAVNPQADTDTVRAVFLGKIIWNEEPPSRTPKKVDPERASLMVNALSRLMTAVSGFIKQVDLDEDMERRATAILSDFRLFLVDLAKAIKANAGG